MAGIQWNRYINQLCERYGDTQYDKYLLGCISALYHSGTTSPKQGNWLVKNIGMHLFVKVQHIGPVTLTKEQRRHIKQAVNAAVPLVSEERGKFLSKYFPHHFHTVSTRFSHRFHTKGANNPVKPRCYSPYIDRILIKIIDGPLAQSDVFSPNSFDGGSPVARHPEISNGTSPIGMNANVKDEAASPLRGFAAKSDEPLGDEKRPIEGNATSAKEAMAKAKSRQVDANASKATISLWVKGGSKSSATAILELGKEKLRLNFVAPRKAEKLNYITEHGKQEDREWLAALTAKTDAAAKQLSRTLAGKHVASAIHHETDTACRQIGVASGIALLVWDDDTPTSCCVILEDEKLHFDLAPFNSTSQRSPQFKKTISL